MKNTNAFKYYLLQFGLPCMYFTGLIMKLIDIYMYGWEQELKPDELLFEFFMWTLAAFILAIALYLWYWKRNKTTNKDS